ncbi:MAG: secondary thiamine-phosphate synthase enzyme YjbQ [Candidatus Hodarchaeales archaeon]|jgi:secondary thiamine-phosphate synthase enzyme
MILTLTIRSTDHIQFLNITEQIREAVNEKGVHEGICVAYVPHTTAGITINESADPAVPADIVSKLNQLVPRDENYRHAEGNSDAHIKTLLTGNSVTIPISKGLVLGHWQAVFFCEYDGPRTRKVHVTIIKSHA